MCVPRESWPAVLAVGLSFQDPRRRVMQENVPRGQSTVTTAAPPCPVILSK